VARGRKRDEASMIGGGRLSGVKGKQTGWMAHRHRASKVGTVGIVGRYAGHGEKCYAFWEKQSPNCDSMGLRPYPLPN
jgi:prenyltransferase beta subunit